MIGAVAMGDPRAENTKLRGAVTRYTRRRNQLGIRTAHKYINPRESTVLIAGDRPAKYNPTARWRGRKKNNYYLRTVVVIASSNETLIASEEKNYKKN